MEKAAPVALVTGAAQRIGAAIATALHKRGYRVVIHYRNSAQSAGRLQETLEQHWRNSTLLLQADLEDPAAPARLIEQTLLRFGQLDALVNNASVFFPTDFNHTTPALWDRFMHTNARAPFFLSQAAAPHLRASRGSLLNLSDLYAERPLADHAAYCMSKAAISMLTHALAVELAPEVRVNAIAPGAILWPESNPDPARQRELLKRTPLARRGSPEEIAAAATFLIADGDYITGQVLRVDGGRWLSI